MPPSDVAVEVSASLRFTFTEPTRLALLITPATSAGTRSDESLLVLANGRALTDENLRRIDDHGTDTIVFAADAGPVAVDYCAVVHRHAAGPAAPSADDDAVELDRIIALRPSRYAPSDQLSGFAADHFGGTDDRLAQATDIARWIFDHVVYEPASTSGTHTAIDTLLTNAGVCRDFAHLTVALCRGVGIPARLAAVYAPGLLPMDFHAVAEVHADGAWHVLDATRLAPRQTLVRIATGRDAADTAFASTIYGDAQLEEMIVTAVARTDQLPLDDHAQPITLA